MHSSLPRRIIYLTWNHFSYLLVLVLYTVYFLNRIVNIIEFTPECVRMLSTITRPINPRTVFFTSHQVNFSWKSLFLPAVRMCEFLQNSSLTTVSITIGSIIFYSPNYSFHYQQTTSAFSRRQRVKFILLLPMLYTIFQLKQCQMQRDLIQVSNQFYSFPFVFSLIFWISIALLCTNGANFFSKIFYLKLLKFILLDSS